MVQSQTTKNSAFHPSFPNFQRTSWFSPVARDLSIEAKQSFMVVNLLATALVVGIHYKSDVPDNPNIAMATWNQLGQEFWFGGIARVAVPIFAFVAGLFYFRSDDGSFATYRRKLGERGRSVGIPFFTVASVAMVCWLLVRSGEGKPIELSVPKFLEMWFLSPPAEQLWFLRDLIVMVVVAPVIRWFCQRRMPSVLFLGVVASAWAIDWQVFPMVAGWRLLQMETLLFFSLGCIAVSRYHWVERVGCSSTTMLVLGWLLWCGLVGTRVMLRPDFDIWYAADHGRADLMFHQCSILVGVPTLFATAWRLRRPWLLNLSGGSFFVYLVHEFPVRAIAHRISDRLIDHEFSCWVLTPIVLVGGYTTAVMLSRFAPRGFAILTGGRAPTMGKKSAATSPTHSSHSPTQTSVS